MKQWEYFSVKMETSGWLGGIFDHKKFTEQANDLGELGWEMISAFDTNQSGGESREVIIIFKREKQD